MALSEKIKKIRQDKNITQAELAKRTGLSKTYISMLEKGHQVARPNTLSKIANGLGVAFEDLYEEN